MEEYEEYKEEITKLIQDIERVKKGGVLKIFCGEMNCKVYNGVAKINGKEKKVYEALKDLKTKGGSIQVTGGPIILVSEEDKRNDLLEAKRVEIIDRFYIRPRREAAIHYRLIINPDKEVNGLPIYVELPHRFLALKTERKVAKFNNGGENPWFWLEKLNLDFDQRIKELGEENTSQQYIPLTHSQAKDFVHFLQERFKEEKKVFDFDFMELDEIENLIQSWGKKDIQVQKI